MAEVIWSAQALDDLDAIGGYISQFDGAAAGRMQMRLRKAGDSLEAQPLRGRRVAGRLRVLVNIKPYLIRYLVVGEFVFILGVRHGARRPL